MTSNQIEYHKLKENKRHNVVTEKETGRHNQADEGIQTARNAITLSLGTGELEVARRNADTNWYNAQINARNADTNRYNAWVNERNAEINQQNANTRAFEAETGRLSYYNDVERTAIAAFEADTNRMNSYWNGVNATINMGNYAVNAYNANTKRYEADLKAAQIEGDLALRELEYQEHKRHNEMQETIDVWGRVMGLLGPMAALSGG